MVQLAALGLYPPPLSNYPPGKASADDSKVMQVNRQAKVPPGKTENVNTDNRDSATTASRWGSQRGKDKKGMLAG